MYNKHTLSFHSEGYKHSTELSKYIWSLQDSNNEFSLKWCIKTTGMSYSCGVWKYDLCLAETVAIAQFEAVGLLNKQIELLSKCWYRNKFIIGNLKWRKTSAVTKLLFNYCFIALLKYQLNCVIVRVSVECYTPVKECIY